MSYEIRFRPGAWRELRKLEPPVAVRVKAAIDALASDPRPSGCRKLAGQNKWRIWIGSYRVIYMIEDQRLIVLITRVAHRREVYER